MKGLFWLSLLLTHLCGTESREEEASCLSQPHQVIFGETEQSAVIDCIISNCSSEDHYHWFVFRKEDHLFLPITGRYTLNGASLQISSLNTSDSGVYHCAITSSSEKECCKHHVGVGTALVVRELQKPQLRKTLLWLSFALLTIYSLALVVLIILKKHGREISICKTMSRKSTANSVRKTTQFRDVLQELHSRGTFTKTKAKRRNLSRVEEASGESNISADDIYQNV